MTKRAEKTKKHQGKRGERQKKRWMEVKGRQIKAQRNQLWRGRPRGKRWKLNNRTVKVVVLSSEPSTTGEIRREAQLQVI